MKVKRLSHKMLVLIPAYNEERFIGSVVLKTRQYVDMVLVVDDGSSDSTCEIAKAAGAIVVTHDRNSGKGVALNTGFAKAREYQPDVVITLDGDWQHLPEQIAQVAQPILLGQADVVVGSRYLEDTSDVPVARIIGHWGFTQMTNLLSGVSLTDSQSGYRAFSPTALEKLSFSSQSFSVESEMQFLVKDYQLKIMEVPIIIRYNDKPKRPVISHGFNVLNGILSLVAQHRPLLFFGIPGVFALVIGLILGAFTIHGFNVNQALPIGTSLLVVIFLVMGLFLLLTGIILWAMRTWLDEIKNLVRR